MIASTYVTNKYKRPYYRFENDFIKWINDVTNGATNNARDIAQNNEHY